MWTLGPTSPTNKSPHGRATALYDEKDTEEPPETGTKNRMVGGGKEEKGGGYHTKN